MKIFLDWETKDPYIGLGYGPGWVFALRGYTNPEFKLLGCSIRKENENEAKYYTDLNEIFTIVNQADIIINHNCMYDVGCLLYAAKQANIKWDYEKVEFHDTVLMTKLVDQDHFSYSLEACSKRCGGTEKSKSTLTDEVWNSGLYQKWYKEHTNRNSKTRPDEKKLFALAMGNLDIMPEEIVAEYCNFDVSATYDVYQDALEKLKKFGKRFNLADYSELIKVCVDIKLRGVRIDLEQANKAKVLLKEFTANLLKEIYEEVGNEFNINSSVQVVAALKKVGIINFDKTEKGQESANKTWLEEQPQEICKKIIKARNYKKLCGDFIEKLIKYQDIHIQNGSEDYRVFPNFNILGATKTGRMSSSRYRRDSSELGDRKDSFELNFQQIPKRGEDKEAGRYVRSIFIAEEGETWIGADYSNQEQRLQVEFAHRSNLASAYPVLQRFKDNPFSDFHQIVADICDIERSPAKTINLGLSYSMGQAKLCKSLGLPTKWTTTKYGIREVAGKEGEVILSKYHKFLPFMKELQDLASRALTEDGYISTIGGRRLFLDKPFWDGKELKTFEYKGLSKLVQGSAADVTMQAMINCRRAGLTVLLIVHDEICISTRNQERDKKLLKDCMENTYKTQVPMVVEISEGQSWAD